MFLEQEVAIKTQELKQANQKLGVYIKQVENLNQYLETDNDKLKIKVIDQIKARSDDKIITVNAGKGFHAAQIGTDTGFGHGETIGFLAAHRGQ